MISEAPDILLRRDLLQILSIIKHQACICVCLCKVSTCYTKLGNSPLAHSGSPTLHNVKDPPASWGAIFFVHFNMGQPRMLSVQSPSSTLSLNIFEHSTTLKTQWDKRPSINRPCHKSHVAAISDTFSSLSSSCVSRDFSPDSRMLRNVLN